MYLLDSYFQCMIVFKLVVQECCEEFQEKVMCFVDYIVDKFVEMVWLFVDEVVDKFQFEMLEDMEGIVKV